MTLLVVILFVILTFNGFCSGYVLRDVEQKAKEEDISFHEAWKEYVEENQDSSFGRAMMKGYYIIPTIAGIISSCRSPEKSEI